MKSTIITIGAATLVALALAGCTGSPTPPTRPVTFSPIPTGTITSPTPTGTIFSPTPTGTITSPTPPTPTVTVTKWETRAASGQPPASSGANQVIVWFSGTGTRNTPSFTTSDNWHLSWSYWGCPGGTSNFVVDEYNSDGSLDPNGISVNELGTGRALAATYVHGDAGTHYLSVNTQGCSWLLVSVTG
jgi:hypothetical protein